MNTFYTLIYLIQEWKRSLQGTYFVEALSSRKNTLVLYFQSATDPGNEPVPLMVSVDPRRTAAFIDRYREPRRANTAVFFSALSGAKLIDVKLAEADRYIRFVFEGDSELILMLYSSKANVIFSDTGTVREAFKREQELAGLPVPPPSPAQSKDVSEGKPDRIMFARQPLLPRTVVRHWMKIHEKEQLTAEQLRGEADKLDKILRSGANPHVSPAYGFSTLSPLELGNPEVPVLESVNQSVAKAFYTQVRQQDFSVRKSNLETRFTKTLDKINRSLSELQGLDKTLEKAAYWEEVGHLLMANPQVLPDGDTVELDDFYNPGSRRTVPVDRTLSMVKNAQEYYDKARAARQRHGASTQRIGRLEQKISKIEALNDELRQIHYPAELDKWIKRREEDLRHFGLNRDMGPQSSLPYKKAYLSGYEIRIGKNASSNDELLRISHKEDIWLHARGVSGSHVIIVMDKKTGMPPKPVVEQAASYAAFFSKGKGSSLHPVIFTKRKYVRKPKGGAPGAVNVDKEQVVLVAPGDPGVSEE
ncbi:MAG: putative RNA-binding protein homologous to eukaryotic snRNP [Bacteroidetes bacterium HLUCCA01]|nr:MAG: putative RNA-binding protein homologous to eukaryotic snRNP [Bacteroidetes bacterium HLUCCA01]